MTTATIQTTFARLPSGEWGIRCAADLATPGTQVSVSKRDGTLTVATVGAVLSTVDGVATCSIAAAPRAPAPAHSSHGGRGGFRICSYCDRRVPRAALCCGDGE